MVMNTLGTPVGAKEERKRRGQGQEHRARVQRRRQREGERKKGGHLGLLPTVRTLFML